MKTVILLLIAAVATTLGQDDALPEFTRTPFGDSIDIASMKLLKETYEQSSDKNIVISPLSVLTLLSLYASASDGKIQEEIMNLLGITDYKQLLSTQQSDKNETALPLSALTLLSMFTSESDRKKREEFLNLLRSTPYEKVSDSFVQLSQKFGSIDPSLLVLANKILVSDNYTLNEEFYNTAKNYRSAVDSINFDNKKTAADTINLWASNMTKGIIKHPFSENDIDSSVAVALLNAIYFKGHWRISFNASYTQEDDFKIDRSTSVKKPMMYLSQSLHYRENENMAAKMIELPYKESKFRMIVVLPEKVDGLPEVLKKISTKGLLEDIFQMSTSVEEEVVLFMPKFEIRSKIKFEDILPKVGVSSIFEHESNGIVKESGVKVSRVLQEAFIKIDEEGSTAAAFTAAILVLRCASSEVYFKVDRPFLYVILHEDIVLFAGTYTH